MERKSQWFIYLTFSSPDVVQGHWTMASSNCYSVIPLIIADHVEPELNILTTTTKTKQKPRWDDLHMEVDRVYLKDGSQLWYILLNKYIYN